MLEEVQQIRVQGPASGREVALEVPGDKSISHRAVMLGGIATGTTRIRGFLPSNDCLATIEAMRTLGVDIEYDGGVVTVHGRGAAGLVEPVRPVECGGSGTTMRLLAGGVGGGALFKVIGGGGANRPPPPWARGGAPRGRGGAPPRGGSGGGSPPS